jgi:hypothetical protein
MNSRTLLSLAIISLYAAASGCIYGGEHEDPDSLAEAEQAAMFFGPPPGELVQIVDYRDTFTLGGARTDGLCNNNSAGAYAVENAPDRVWTPTYNFSFNTPQSSTAPSLVGAALGNPGGATGLAQSGGGDFSFSYGKRMSYVVQADAILPSDRFDISSLPFAGATIYAGSSLSVFFRRDGTGLPGIGLFNGTTEKDTGLSTGITDSNWHNFAVNFDQEESRLRIFVDGSLKGNIDLTAFAGGEYTNYSNAAVGMGGNGDGGYNTVGASVTWMDNFTVGAPRLIEQLLFSDTFTLGGARTDGLYNDNSAGAYNVELHRYDAVWTPTYNFSFNTPQSSTNPSLLGAALGNPGAGTGVAQSGGGDFSFGTNSWHHNYVVQADAIIAADRFDISSLPYPGATIFSDCSLSVFFRRPSTPGALLPVLPEIGVFNGTTETDTGCSTGITDNDWHSFAVNFDRTASRLRMFVDGDLTCDLDLQTFASGVYQSYSDDAVGVGGGYGVTWVDNVQVGLSWQALLPDLFPPPPPSCLAPL